MIGSIRAMHCGRYRAAPGSFRHQECKLPVSGQAHLGKVVEIVLADHHQPRLVQVESSFKRFYRRLQTLFESRIEESRRDAVLPQQSRSDHGLQRRIWLHLSCLFPIGVDVVAVSKKNFGRLIRFAKDRY